MNALTIIQTCQGMRAYLAARNPELAAQGIAIGFDGRHNSRRFAQLAASAFARHGIKVYLFGDIVPTPFVAYTVARFGCGGGIMVTASHNPKEDNGFKAYWHTGAQLLRPHDAAICAEILLHLEPEEGAWDEAAAAASALVSDPRDEITAAYMGEHVGRCSFTGAANRSSTFHIAYSAFHGVGGPFTPPMLAAFGFPEDHIHPVPSQQEPDPDFSTLTGFPNPEEGASVLKLSFETAEATGAGLVLANDPDADRLQVAQKLGSEWRVFTGNEMGTLLADWVWRNWRRQNPEADSSSVVMINSAVSTQFVAALAAAEGFRYEQTLTGFKWMAERTHLLRQEGATVLLAWEESIGFMPGAALDKDGVVAAAMFTELVGSLPDGDLQAQLHRIYNKYGYHISRNSYFLVPSADAKAAVFRGLREPGPPKAIAGTPVAAVRDLTTGVDTGRPDGKPVRPGVTKYGNGVGCRQLGG